MGAILFALRQIGREKEELKELLPFNPLCIETRQAREEAEKAEKPFNPLCIETLQMQLGLRAGITLSILFVRFLSICSLYSASLITFNSPCEILSIQAISKFQRMEVLSILFVRFLSLRTEASTWHGSKNLSILFVRFFRRLSHAQRWQGLSILFVRFVSLTFFSSFS